MWVVEVAVGVDFAQDAQAQPTEVLFTGRTVHLVTTVHLLQAERRDWRSGQQMMCYQQLSLLGTNIVIVYENSIKHLHKN